MDMGSAKKWTVKESYFSDGSNRYADYHKNPLHLISYSKPFKGKVSRKELLKHIRTIKNTPMKYLSITVIMMMNGVFVWLKMN